MRLRGSGLVAYISVVHGFIHTIEITYAVLLLRIDDEFGAGLFVLGIVANAAAFTFGFGALPSGFLADRLGTQRVLFIAFSAAAAGALLVALAPNVALLGVFLALLGLGIGLYHPAGISLIAQVGERRGVALGWHGVVGNLGIAAAPAFAIGAASLFDWRAAYFMLALLAALTAVSLRIVRFEGTDAPAVAMPEQEAGARPALAVTARARVRSFLPLFMVYGVFVLNGFVFRGSLTFLPVHLEERLSFSWFGLDEAWLAGSLTTLALLGGAAGQLFGGYVSERYRLERLAIPMTFSMLPFLLLIASTSGLPLVLFSALFVFAHFGGQPVYAGLIADYSPEGALGRSFGVSFFAAFGIGSGAATVAGFFADRWGTDSVFLVLAGVVLLTLLLAFGIWRHGERVLADGRAVATG